MIPIIKRNTSAFELELPDFALNHHGSVSYSSHPSQPELFGNCEDTSRGVLLFVDSEVLDGTGNLDYAFASISLLAQSKMGQVAKSMDSPQVYPKRSREFFSRPDAGSVFGHGIS